MFCEHGFIAENCPHCQVHTGIKPLVRLVKPTPRKIPVPVPRKEQFLNQPTESMDDFYQPQENIRSIPQKPVRDLDPRSAAFEPKSSLFNQKRLELKSQKHVDEVLHNSDVQIKLEKIEDQFIEKK